MEDYNQTEEEVKLHSGLEEEEEYASDSSVELKLRSVEDDAPASIKTPMSRSSRKKSLKKVAYDNDLKSSGSKRKRGTVNSEALTLALKNAKELQTNLSSEHPSFIKQIQRSHVSRFFKLGIPAEFYRLHMPAQHHDVILEDESGESYTVKFLAGAEGTLIGGWRKFALAHNLVVGDVVVLHLTGLCNFKVYIVRANDPTAVESANLAIVNVPSNEGKKKRKRKAADRKGPRLAPVDTVPESGRTSPLLSDTDLPPLVTVPESGRTILMLANTDLGAGPSSESGRGNLHSSSDMEASQLSGRDADFDNFKIIVNGANIDSDLSRSTRFKYYKLCCSRESYLHKHLLKNVDRELAVGLITGTLNVADEIRACKLCTSKDDFVMWGRSLDGLKSFGMDVDFLRERLERLATLGSELRGKEEVKKYIEAKNKRGQMREDMKSHEMMLLELKQAEGKVKDEMKNMKANILKHKDAYQVEASAPW